MRRRRAMWANGPTSRRTAKLGLHADQTTHPIAADILDVAAAKDKLRRHTTRGIVLGQLSPGSGISYEGACRYLAEHQLVRPTRTCLLRLKAPYNRSFLPGRAETSGPLTLSVRVTDSVGAITDFTLHQGGEACNGVLRPHRVTMTWRVAGASHVQTSVSRQRPIDPEGVITGLAAASADPAVVNDDLTYAISRSIDRCRAGLWASISREPSSGRRCGTPCATVCWIRAALSSRF